MSQIKVFLVDDDPEWLGMMKIFLENFPDITVVGAAATRDEAVIMAQTLDIDVILMDINLTETRYDGIYAAAEICRLKTVKILMLTSLNEEDVILNSFIAGAVNYIPKSNYLEVPEAIRATYLNRSPVEIALRDYSRLKKTEQLLNLTPSELEIYSLAEQGYNQAQISQCLQKSEQTIKNQIGVILKKLDVKHLKDAIIKVKTKGIIKK
ncbi:MAG TPA: DNA-binding response regulator [Firmicutes bacterium]|jgi:two-component system, NarL family, response regulator DevR|nr:DNA-binding response regulator [Bacillota bacterium]